MVDAISLTPPSPGLSETLFPSKSVGPYSPKVPEHVKITTLYQCTGGLVKAAAITVSIRNAGKVVRTPAVRYFHARLW